jgi:hypothetical protein
MFNHAKKTFSDDETMAAWVDAQEKIDNMIDKHGLLMPL